MRPRLGEDGSLTAECPSLPGCVSQGETQETALANIQEAIQAYVGALEADNLPVPQETSRRAWSPCEFLSRSFSGAHARGHWSGWDFSSSGRSVGSHMIRRRDDPFSQVVTGRWIEARYARS